MESHSPTYKAKGVIKFIQTTPIGIMIQGNMSGLTPNQQHAFHIHELGDLTNGCTSLAAHFNPFSVNHGGPESCHRHIGDLGNI